MKQARLSLQDKGGHISLEFGLEESECSEAELMRDFHPRQSTVQADQYWSTCIISSGDPIGCPVSLKQRNASDVQRIIDEAPVDPSLVISSPYFYDSTKIDKKLLMRSPQSVLLSVEQVHAATICAANMAQSRDRVRTQLGTSVQDLANAVNTLRPDSAAPTQKLEAMVGGRSHQLSCSASLSSRVNKMVELKQFRDQLKLQLEQKALSLSRLEGLSHARISRRLGISLYKVRQILKRQQDYINAGPARPSTRARYPLLKDSIRKAIITFVRTSSTLVQSRDIKAFLKSEYGIIISKSHLIKFLKNEMGLSYQRVGVVTPNQNSMECKAQRQKGALEFIRILSEGKTVINIDESVLSSTDHRKQGWSFSRERTRQPFRQRLPSHNIIAGVSNFNEVFFTINRGKTNSFTFLLFMHRLSLYLDTKQPGWRLTTVLIIDNATYHRSRATLRFFQAHALPIMFLGPYNFHMAPVEKFFAYIKNRDLNPQHNRNSGQQFQFLFNHFYFREMAAKFMQEVASLLRGLDYSWLASAFRACLVAAINCLSLQDI